MCHSEVAAGNRRISDSFRIGTTRFFASLRMTAPDRVPVHEAFDGIIWDVTSMRRSREHRRRGSMYVAVLGSAMAVTVMGLSAIMLARVERSEVGGLTDAAAARFYAQSAIEIGQQRIRQDSNWRTTYTSGVWETNRAIGTGTYTLEGIDTVDGNLSNSSSDLSVRTPTGERRTPAACGRSVARSGRACTRWKASTPSTAT